MVNREKVPYFKFPDISSTYKAEDFLAWSYTILKTGPALRCPHDLARYAQVSNSRSSLAFNAAQTVWKVYHDVEKIPFFKALPLFLLYAF
jgi:hypothetical protein